MFKNSENINYFQKNKIMVLSLIGIGFLTGAAVIDRGIPGRGIAGVYRVHPDEELRIPPHRVIPKDKLPPVKPKGEARALVWINCPRPVLIIITPSFILLIE